MVVECGKCGTRFQLDSSRIPDAGIRVRCSRCKHAFFLQHPSQSQANVIDSLAEEAALHESLPPPTATHDLARNGDAAPGVGAANEFGGLDDEEDWEFNEDPISDDDSDECNQIDADADIDFDLESDAEGFSAEAFDQDGDASERVELAGADAESVMNGSSGTVPDSHEIGADDLVPSNMNVEFERDGDDPRDKAYDDHSDGPAPGFGGARENDAFGSMEDYAGSRANDVVEQPLTAASTSEQENVEDPESWDFFGENVTPTPARAPATSAVREDAVARLAAVNPAAMGVDADSEWLAYERQGPVGAVSRIASALMTVAVFGLLAAGIYLGVIGAFDSGVRTPAFVDIGQMRAANIRGQWVETESAGTLYVVSGDLLNPGTTPASPDRAVRVTLLGADGNALDVGSLFAGSGLEFDWLRQVAPGDVSSTQVSAARSLARRQIVPRESVRIAAAFMDLPRDATHFTLNAVDPVALDEWATQFGFAPLAAEEVGIDGAQPVIVLEADEAVAAPQP